MYMNRIKFLLCQFLLAGTVLLGSCSEFTDIQPKGKNLLSTTDQLEMLLNAEFYDNAKDEQIMAGDIIYAYSNVPSQLSLPNKTRNVILWTWDAANMDKMAELTNADTQYSDFYGYIGKICNPILSQLDNATGSEEKKKQLKCEALTLRAYFHYLLVNKFAKAYNPSTAADDRGIIYMTEDKDIEQPQEQSTVQQVYDHILEDVNEAIELDGLPEIAVNRMRMSKPCAYAVKALALLSMQKWDEAETAAKQALALDGTINNYNDMLKQTISGEFTGKQFAAILRPRLQCEEDLFYVHNIEFYNSVLPEAQKRVEPGNTALEKIANMNMLYENTIDAGEIMTGLKGNVVTYDLQSGWNACGLKTTDLYLAIAEAELHKGNIDNAMDELDKIRKNRILPEKYVPLKGKVTNEADAISHLKQTSAGEGLWTFYNFLNRKRWNQVKGWEETLTKELNGKTYTLAPDSPMWIFPFPLDAVNNNPNLKQNYK